MKTTFYKIQCLTNLHVGSGDVNYNIIDNEVEKDPTTGLPMIHASGVKGALRDVAEKNDAIKSEVNRIFGSPGNDTVSNAGAYKFFDAYMLCRPMRVSGSISKASIPVVSIASVNLFLQRLTDFDCNNFGITKIDTPDFGNNAFLTNSTENISVEGESTGKIEDKVAEQLLMLSSMIGEEFAVVKSFDDFPLPVIARNKLVNKESKNLWYEEIVPHGSVLYFAVMTPDDDTKMELVVPKQVQFGGNATIGCGFTNVTKI